MTPNPMRMLAIVCATAGAFTWTAEAEAQEIMSRSCNVDQVGVYANRIHLKCIPDPQRAYTGDIRYYAMAITGDARVLGVVENVVALAIAAKQTNKPMVIQFDMADYRSVPGCQGNDCRKLVSAALE